MKKHLLFTIASVLIIISALSLIFASTNIPSSTSSQESQLTKDYYKLIEELNKQKSDNKLADNVFLDYDKLNLVFSDSKTHSVKNINYDLQNGQIYWLDDKLIIADRNKEKETININIPYGLKGSEISALLAENNLIEDKDKFNKLLLKLDINKKLLAGEYSFTQESTLVDVLLSITAN